MVSESVRKWLRGPQSNPVSHDPTRSANNSWGNSKRLCSMWRSPNYSAATEWNEQQMILSADAFGNREE